MKTCRICGVEKPFADFYRMAGMRDGHRNECKRCDLDRKAARHRRNPEPARERARQWKIDNPDRALRTTRPFGHPGGSRSRTGRAT